MPLCPRRGPRECPQRLARRRGRSQRSRRELGMIQPFPKQRKSLTGLFLQVTNAHLGRAGITDCAASIPPGMQPGEVPAPAASSWILGSVEGNKPGKGN